MEEGGVTMDAEDVVLGIVKAAGNEITGRTYLQKVAYFVSEIMGIPLAFGPHYYGPYSSSVSSETEAQVAMGRLMETPESFGGGQIRYTYALTGKGEKYLEACRAFDPGGFEELDSIVDRIIATRANYSDLACAAKLYYLLEQAGGSIKSSVAEAEAKGLGWRISKEDFATAVRILRKLELVQ
jgi:uncharacterized protein YwgA